MVRKTKKNKRSKKIKQQKGQYRKRRSRRNRGGSVFAVPDVLNNISSYLKKTELEQLLPALGKEIYENHFKPIELDDNQSWEYLHTPEGRRDQFLKEIVGNKSFETHTQLCLRFTRRNFSSGVIPIFTKDDTRGMDAFSNCRSITFYDCYFPTQRRSEENGKGNKACIENVGNVNIHHCRKIDDCYFLSKLNIVKITEFSSIYIKHLPRLANVDILTLSFCFFYTYKRVDDNDNHQTALANYNADLDGDDYDNNRNGTIRFSLNPAYYASYAFNSLKCSMLDLTCTAVPVLNLNLTYLNVSFSPHFNLNNVVRGGNVTTIDITGFAGLVDAHEDEDQPLYIFPTTEEEIDIYQRRNPNTRVIHKNVEGHNVRPIHNTYAKDIGKQMFPEYDVYPPVPDIHWFNYNLYAIGKLAAYYTGEYNP